MHESLARINFEHDVAALSEVFAERQKLVVHARSYPMLDVTVEHTKPLRLRLQGDSFDELPPAIELLNSDGASWSGPLPGGIFHAGPHPITGKPFVCMRGAREYHTHSSHLADKWDNYRGQDGMGIVGILMQVASVWRRDVR